MRTTGLLVVAAAVAAHANYVEKDGEYVCEQPNASYCLGGDIILRCDAYGKGTPGRCSDNIPAGYPPVGGVASCYEKPGTHGEAACEKDCVVYYTGAPYTLPAELCHPSHPSTTATVDTLTTIYTYPVPETTAKAHYNTTRAGHPGGPGETTKPGHPGRPGHHGHHGNSTQPGQPTATGYTTKCVTFVYPNPTHSGESKTRTITYTTALYPPGGETHQSKYPPHTTMHSVPSGSLPPPSKNGTCHTCHGGHGGYGGKGAQGDNGNKGEGIQNKGVSASGSETGSPTSTSEPGTPTGAAAVNTVSGMLALAAVAAAYLI